MPRRRPSSKEVRNRRLAARVQRWQEKLQKELPDIDPHDLGLILYNMLRPHGRSPRFLLREVRKGVYVF